MDSRTRATHKVKREIVRYRKAHPELTVKKIAGHYGFSVNTIYITCRELGFQPGRILKRGDREGTTYRPGVKRLTQKVKRGIVRFRKAHPELTVTDVARHFNLTAQSIYLVCRELGYRPGRRTKSEGRRTRGEGRRGKGEYADYADYTEGSDTKRRGFKPGKWQPESLGIRGVQGGVTIDTSFWEKARGKKPKGKGVWAFSMGGAPEVLQGNWKWAVGVILARARGKGFRGEILLRA